MPRNGGVSFIRSCVFFGFAVLRQAGWPLTFCWRETGLPLTRHGVRQQRSGARRNRAFVIVEDNDRKEIGVERRKDDRNTTNRAQAVLSILGSSTPPSGGSPILSPGSRCQLDPPSEIRRMDIRDVEATHGY